jgi:hypothetical protein
MNADKMLAMHFLTLLADCVSALQARLAYGELNHDGRKNGRVWARPEGTIGTNNER